MKTIVWVCLLSTAACQYCEDCRGVITPFCSESCTCNKCQGDVGSLYGKWSCTGCQGKLTPWCGRWCWCSSCEELSSPFDLLAWEEGGGRELWSQNMMVGLAVCAAFGGVLLIQCLLVCKTSIRSTDAMQTPLLSSEPADSVPVEDPRR
ncbi:unnamed protein product [Symbiodinium natans]|uniref:Uncharacterized protein n=1 Tax=Symbiodinium natans TaxID=878477 RepID=A0A812RJY2_9DINO|nr:unnamed protein product [Symbiodinium natans]